MVYGMVCICSLIHPLLPLHSFMLMAGLAEKNRNLMWQRREDVHSDKLMQAVLDDAAMSRMSNPVKLDPSEVTDFVLSPRFGVVQGRYI